MGPIKHTRPNGDYAPSVRYIEIYILYIYIWNKYVVESQDHSILNWLPQMHHKFGHILH